MFGLGFKFPQLGAGGASLSTQIRELFANGEEGGMWDFTSPKGLYQDAEGSTPVTAVGQPVGLVLDRRFGLAKPLVGTIDSLVTVGTVYRDEAGIHIAGTGEVAINYAQLNGLIGGRTYELTLNYSAPGTNARPVLRGGAGTVVPPIGASSHIFVSSVNYIRVTCHASLPTDATITEFSVREIPGNHLSQDTTVARPTYTEDGALHDGVDDFLAAADAADWTFLHDGSGSTLGLSGSWEGYEGTSRKLTGTHGGSDANSRAMSVGYYNGIRTMVGRGESGLVQVTTGVIPDPATLYTAIGTLDTDEVACWVDGSRYANTVDFPLSQDAASNPLRTTISPHNGDVSYFHRIIAISRVLTDSEISLVNAWLREGA